MSELHGIARFKIDADQVDEYKRLSAQCMEIVRTQDTGTLHDGIHSTTTTRPSTSS